LLTFLATPIMLQPSMPIIFTHTCCYGWWWHVWDACPRPCVHGSGISVMMVQAVGTYSCLGW
jgi:hypothetical protein